MVQDAQLVSSAIPPFSPLLFSSRPKHIHGPCLLRLSFCVFRYFFAVTNYFLYGESIIYYFKHVVFVDAYFAI